jgi:cell volume regulation protein A
MSAGALGFTLMIGAATVVAAVLAARLAHSAGLPALLVFLGLGLALGESGVGIRFDNAELTEVLGLSALVLILAEGGLTTNWAHARPAMPAALLLATVGVGVSIVVVGVGARYLLGFTWRDSLLLGAVLAPTDAAAVFSVLRRLPLPPALSGMLEGESGLNDPPSVLAVTLLSAGTGNAGGSGSGGGMSPWLVVGEICWELAGGFLIGLAVGLLGIVFLRRVALPASGLYPVAVLAFVVFGYGAATLAAASGFLAVYVSAVLLGNARLPHGPATRGFAEGIGWLSQIGLFVLLGLLASPSRLPGQLLPALTVGVIVVFLARPVSVVLAILPLRLPCRATAHAAARIGSLAVAWMPHRVRRQVLLSGVRARVRLRDGRSRGHTVVRVPWRQQAFLSWAGLRGAVPIVLTTIPLSRHVAGATRLFDIVFVMVIAFTLLQGPTLPWLGRLLRVIAPAEPLEILVEAAPLEELHAELLQVSIPPESQLHGVEIFELRLPSTVNLALIVRDGAGFVPEPTTMLRSGDRLLIVTPPTVREQTERRLRAVSRAGKLAGWFGEHGDLSPDVNGSGRRRPAARRWPLQEAGCAGLPCTLRRSDHRGWSRLRRACPAGDRGTSMR